MAAAGGNHDFGLRFLYGRSRGRRGSLLLDDNHLAVLRRGTALPLDILRFRFTLLPFNEFYLGFLGIV
jgi:hypothetical protein